MGAVIYFVWMKMAGKPAPIVGDWVKGGIVFAFEADGDLLSNAMFQPDGTFYSGAANINSRWRLVGNRITITPRAEKPRSRDVSWEISEGGKKLTLKGIDSVGTFRSALTLTRRDGRSVEAAGR